MFIGLYSDAEFGEWLRVYVEQIEVYQQEIHHAGDVWKLY